MPGGLPKNRTRWPRPIAAALSLPAILLFIAPPAAADNPGLPPPAVPAIPFWPHLTDGQDRPGSDRLRPAAETKSLADALYADAVVSQEASSDDTDKILKELRQVVTIDPRNEEAQIRIAKVLLQTGQIESAFTQLQAAFAAVPHSVAIEAMLGYAQRLRGQNDEALRLSTQALAKDPTQAVSMRVLLEIAGDQNDLSGAVVHIEDLLKAGGSGVPASAWLTLGRLYMEIARNDTQDFSGEVVLRTLLPIYRQAAAKDPPEVETLSLLSQTYQDLGRREEALKTLREALELEPGNLDILLRCARLEMGLGRNNDALRDYQTAYRLNPNLTGLREMLGRLYLDHDMFDSATQLLQDALADQPGDPGIEADLGVACEGAHHPALAEQWFQRAFSSPSCPPEAYLKLVVFQLAAQKIGEAAQTLATAQARFPQSPKILFYQAVQNRYAKKYAAALACLAAMRKLAPPADDEVFDPDFYLENSTILNLAGQSAAIEPILREGLQKYPRNPDLMNELAYFWADHGTHLPQALELSRRALELAPDNGPIEDTRGWVYFKMGKANDALPYLQRAAVLTNNDPVVLQHLGDACLKMGRTRDAVAAWRLALKKDSGNRDLATRIAAALAPANHAYPRSALHN